MSNKIVVVLSNSQHNDANNKQMLDFNFLVANAVPQMNKAAHIVAYLTASKICAAGTSINQILWDPEGAAGAIPLPYPIVEYAALRAANPTLPDVSAYGVIFGSSGLCPIGTSLCVQERTATPGRSGRGRHFLPYCNSGGVAPNGGVSAQTISEVAIAQAGFLAFAAPGTVNLGLCVYSQKLSIDSVITSYSSSLVYSSLRTRRR